MKPRLETATFPLLLASWPSRAPSYVAVSVALRLRRQSKCTSYCQPTSCGSKSINVTSPRHRHTSSYSGAQTSNVRNSANTNATAAPRRPRASTPGRRLSPPRAHIFPDCQSAKVASNSRISNAQRERQSPLGSTEPTQLGGLHRPLAETSLSSAAAINLVAQLDRNSVFAACPLLYTVTISTAVLEALVSSDTQARQTAPRELTVLMQKLQALVSRPASSQGASGVLSDDASWSTLAFPVVSALCASLRRRGSAVSEAAFVECICQMLSNVSEEMAGLADLMVRTLLAYWFPSSSYSSSAPRGAAPTATHVESVVRLLIESASATLLPALLGALQVHTKPTNADALPLVTSFASSPSALCTAERFHGAQRWHPCLSDAAVKVCLQRAVQILTHSSSGSHQGNSGRNSNGSTNNSSSAGSRGKQTSASVELTPVARHRLQLCCVCQLPPLTDDRTLHDCAVLTMGALKGAAFADLVAAYAYFTAEGLASVPVALRFLTNCGMCVPHVTQHGVSLNVYIAALAARSLRGMTASTLPYSATVRNRAAGLRVPAEVLTSLLHARRVLLDSGRPPQQIEGGLVHVNAVLNALGYAADVRAFYVVPPQSGSTPSLARVRETPHSVMAAVRLRDVAAAIAALADLGASRQEGWVFVPLPVVECMEAVSHLVGEAGTPAQVDALYVALIRFHNGALFTSHYVELVLAGVCVRIRNLRRLADTPSLPGHSLHGKRGLSKATPREVLDRVIPVVRATLRYVGDELNADMILELVETALHVTDYAVSLTAALVWAFRAWMDLSLCLQELLCRVDASTHNVPFLHYYALCYARDFCAAAVFDHLAVLWHVDGDAIWHRAAHLSPSCQLWKCAACGRLNSDRHNYCLCSALRYSHVRCGACGYAQDERWRQCRSCGSALLSATALSGAIARKGWSCGDCGARNPAKQTLLCFRCGHPTGPCFRATAAAGSEGVSGARSSLAELKKFCTCYDSDGEADTASAALQEGVGSSGSSSSSKNHRHRPSSAREAQEERNASLYAAAVGVCRRCGHFKMDHAAQHSAVWVCTGCQQRRSALERICPSCPQVECLPHAVLRDALAVPRVCRHCQHPELNPFTLVCSACGSSDEPFRPVAEAAAVAANTTEATSATVFSSASSTLDNVLNTTDGLSKVVSSATTTSGGELHFCFHCQHVQPWVAVAAALHACCDSCGAPCEERGRCRLPPRSCAECGTALPKELGGAMVCPTCAAYVPPIDQSATVAASDGHPWSAVAVLHTCEALEECCARAADGFHGRSVTSPASSISAACATDALALAPADKSTSAGPPDATTFLQRRPVLEKTLTRLYEEWTGDALRASTWLPIRVDVAMVLGRALHRLHPHLSTALTARRLSALLKALLTHVDALCGTAATGSRDTTVGRYNAETHFLREELCHLCLGTHPPALCPFSADGGRWTCELCGVANNNDDVGRYVCAACLALRPVVQDFLVSTCWTCHDCHRANIEFERYCVHCEQERINWTAALLPTPPYGATDDVDTVKSEADAVSAVDAEGSTEAAGEVAGQLSAMPRDDEIPFTPAKCHLCGLVYIESRCPLCQNHIPDVADATGTVCEVRARHAFIQPYGTSRVQDRIFVDEALLHANALREGLEVRYTAELGARGRMRATALRV